MRDQTHDRTGSVILPGQGFIFKNLRLFYLLDRCMILFKVRERIKNQTKDRARRKCLDGCDELKDISLFSL